MRFLSLFSGIEAASVAWEPLGWSPVGFCEIDPFPCALLGHRYPSVPNLGSVTDVTGETLQSLGEIDLAVFGWPCQDHSVAGKRAGLAGKRSGLFYEATRIVRLAAERGCKWFVAENVPGVLSSDGGRDFAEVIREITGLTFPVPRDGWGNGGVVGRNDGGWSLAWRVLDAQFFGVPQRRRRVFVVGRAGDWRGPAAVLFERHSLSGNPPPSRESREDATEGVARSLRARSNLAHREDADTLIPAVAGSQTARYGKGTDSDATDPMVVTHVPEVAFGLQSQAGRYESGSHTNYVAHTLRGEGFDASEDGTGRGTPLVPVAYQCQGSNVGQMGTIRKGNGNTSGGVPFIAFNPQAGGKQTSLGYDPGSHTTGTLSVGQVPAVAAWDPRNVTSNVNRTRVEPGLPAPTLHQQGMSIIGAGVRRLTPLECERLQGFPDHWTAVPYRGKPAADGPRYKAIGNSMAIPPMAWLGQRIDLVSKVLEGWG